MGSDANRLRKKWQDYSGKNASDAEKSFFEVFSVGFIDSDFRIREKPNEFSKIYVNQQLEDEIIAEIHNPDTPITKHGVFPDYAIDNTKTGKTIYIEVKRQDGWIEGGKRSDGRGNAHERSCKFFTPGLQNILRNKGKLSKDVLPFWVVFQGDITRDPCRVREVTCWYGDEYKGHFFFWRNSSDPMKLFEHFVKYIEPLLD